MGIAGCQVKVDNIPDDRAIFRRPRLFRLDGVFAGLGEGCFGLFAGNFRVEGIAVKAQLEPFTEAAFEIGLQFPITGTEAAGTQYKGYIQPLETVSDSVPFRMRAYFSSWVR